jgi:diguanylate cyclase (GGDEF)-like protein
MDIDSLTGIGSRALLERRLASACDRQISTAAPLTLIRISIDGLAEFAAHNAASALDSELVRLARCFELCVRAGDTIARYSCAEFVLLLVDTDAAVGADVAERCRSAAAGAAIRHPGPLTVSVGYATAWRQSTPLDLMAEAGIALREAQASGGNIVAMYRPLVEQL